MKFIETRIPGVYRVRHEPIEDERGYFCRSWCEREFSDHGLVGRMVQLNVGFSLAKGTLRGMHYQLEPAGEAKLVRCTRGRVFDVAVDLRRGSPTYLQWAGLELAAEEGEMLYMPPGCAHGYQTLTDDAEIYYLTSQFYRPELATGVRYNDPAFGIEWPLPVAAISDKDAEWPDFRP